MKMRKLATLTAVTVLTAAIGFGGAAMAQTVNVTINFDSLGAPVSGTSLDAYLAGFVFTTLTDVSGGVVTVSSTPPTGSSNVVAPSPPNILEQRGGPSTTYTLMFAAPLNSFSFTRAGRCTPLAFPGWSAVAKDSSGATLATVGEGPGGTNAPCNAPTASAVFNFATPGIKSVVFTSGNAGFFGRSSPAFDDLVLGFPGNPDGCDVGSGGNDVKDVIAYSDGTSIFVHVTMCAAMDPKVKYRVHFDYTDQTNQDGDATDEAPDTLDNVGCETTSDDTMKRFKGDKDTGPGLITSATDMLWYEVDYAELTENGASLATGDRVLIWVETQFRGINDRAPNIQEPCSKPQVIGEVLDITLL